MSIGVRQARALIRKAKQRVPEGEEVSHLNIVSMMDMMTILLVFMIKSATTSTGSLDVAADLVLPGSTSRMPPPEEAAKITIAKSAILVEGEPIVGVKAGDVDPSEKKQGAFGMEIDKLSLRLTQHHTRANKIYASRGQDAPAELTIIADQDTPYRLLSSVIYSASKAEYKNYRLIVLQPVD